MEKLKVYIIAGEPSGDFIASRLMKSLYSQYQGNIEFRGIGGKFMEEQGFTSFMPLDSIAIMGFVKVITNAFSLKKSIKNTAEDIIKYQPDILITIDSLGFNKRVVSYIRNQGSLDKKTKFVHYVAPTVWIWKPQRAKQLSELYDYLFCLFDFEVPYFTKEGLKTYCVGHPIIESYQEKGSVERLNSKYNLPKDTKTILLMPGSRMVEVEILLDIFDKAIVKLEKNYSKSLSIIIPTVPHLEGFVRNFSFSFKSNCLVISSQQDKYDSYEKADLAIIASGTTSLELALRNIKMLVTYKVSWFTYFIVKHVFKIDTYASIINIMSDKEIVKELLQKECNVENIYNYAMFALENEIIDKKDKEKINNILYNLGYKNYIPSERASKYLDDIINNKI